jgi:hypothetical protein
LLPDLDNQPLYPPRGTLRFWGNEPRRDHPWRNEDRDGPIGFESKAERARLFAAEMAMQSFALLAAAEGAIAAYADVTGETWKPYEAPTAPAATVSRQSAVAEMAAFQAA